MISRAGLLLLALFGAGGCARGCDGRPHEETALPHVVLVTIDTLRADAVLGDGPRRASTPTLDLLAGAAVVLTQVHAHVPLTLPSHATLFTGLLPTTLGLHDNEPFPLRDDVPTLATLLSAAGYATMAVIGGQPLARGCGLERGFERFDDLPRARAGSTRFGERRADEVTTRALDAFAHPVGGRPRFLFVHYFDVHAPYEPPPECIETGGTDDGARYRGEVTFVDRELARLIAAIRAGGERTLLLVTADHGEGLGDHGERTHGYQLFEETLRVPLLIAELEGSRTSIPPGLQEVPRDELAGLCDLLPTLLIELGLSGPEGPQAMDGRPLQQRTRSTPTAPAHATCYVESLAANLHFGWAQLTGVRLPGATLLHVGADAPLSLPGLELRATGDDDERVMVVPEAPPLADDLLVARDALESARASHPPARTLSPSLPPLAAIGYISGSSDGSRHTLLPLPANARLPSPLARLALLDGLLAAIDLLEQGRSTSAAVRFSELLAQDPDNRAALLFRARARLAIETSAGTGRAARQAVQDLARLQELEPGHVGAALLLPKALALAGSFDDAFTAAEAELARSGGAAAEQLLGSLFLLQRAAGRANPRVNAQRGYDHLLRALELDPEQPELARDLDQELHALASRPGAPDWIKPALERLARRRGRRYRAATSRYLLPDHPLGGPTATRRRPSRGSRRWLSVKGLSHGSSLGR